MPPPLESDLDETNPVGYARLLASLISNFIRQELPMVTSLSLLPPLSPYADAVRRWLDDSVLLAPRFEQFPEGLDVCYIAGSVLKHRKFGYRGVIVGNVDHTCGQPESWIRQMGVDMLPRGRYQPWYHVLVDVRDRPGGQYCYVCHDNISLWVAGAEDLETDLGPIQHPDLFAVFVGYDATRGRYAVPSFA